MADQKVNWIEIDTASLSKADQALMEKMRAAQTAAKEAKAAFVKSVEPKIRKAADVAEDQTILIGDRFGKVSFAVADKAAAKAPGKSKFKLG